MEDLLVCDVVIVGAGPTGLTLANILGRAGVQVVVVERNRSTVRAPRAVSIDDESLRTMQSIDLVDEVLENVAADYGSFYFSASGRCFAKVEPTTREYGFPRRSAFTQPELEATLLAGVRRYPAARLLFEHTVEAIEQNANEATVTVHSNGDGVVKVRSRYVVGSDGARSFCRKRIDSQLTGSSYPQRWLIVDLAETREFLRQTRVVCDPARPLITLPGPGGIRRYEFMLHPNEDEAAVTQPKFVKQLLAANGPDEHCEIIRAQVYTFHALIANKWHDNRIFLAGDAAHLSPPFAGQGLNSGIRDAHNLGWKLAGVVRGQFGSNLMETYFAERQPHARALVQLAVQMGRIMMPTSRVAANLVQSAFKLTRIFPRVHNYFAQMKYKPKPFYERGFLTNVPGTPWAGRMLPQPTVEQVGGRKVLLDDCLTEDCRIVAYGPKAQIWARDSQDHDFGCQNTRPLAILPSIYNPDPANFAGVEVVRAIDKVMDVLVENGETVILLLRPDRYIAATSYVSPRDLAADAKALFESFAPDMTKRSTARLSCGSLS